MTFGAVVMACNAGHAPYAFCLAEQIAEAHPNRDFDICIFSDEELMVPGSLKTLGLRILTWRQTNPFENAPNLSRHSRATWLRLLVPQTVAGTYERVLYLDSDIVLRGAGIGKLLAADLKGRAIGAVRDQQQWRRPLRQVQEYERENLAAAPYFNPHSPNFCAADFVAIVKETLFTLRGRPERDESYVLLNERAGERFLKFVKVARIISRYT